MIGETILHYKILEKLGEGKPVRRLVRRNYFDYSRNSIEKKNENNFAIKNKSKAGSLFLIDRGVL